MTEAEMLERWIEAADEVALLFAHQPDAKVDAAVSQMRENLNVEFRALFPSAAPDVLGAGVDSIVGEIRRRRREIEAAGATPRAMN
jgi:hypothetical protein